MARVQLNLDDDLWKQARLRAFETGVSASFLVEAALRGLMEPPAKTARVIDLPNPEPGYEKAIVVDKAYGQFRPVPKTGKTK